MLVNIAQVSSWGHSQRAIQQVIKQRIHPSLNSRVIQLTCHRAARSWEACSSNPLSRWRESWWSRGSSLKIAGWRRSTLTAFWSITPLVRKTSRRLGLRSTSGTQATHSSSCTSRSTTWTESSPWSLPRRPSSSETCRRPRLTQMALPIL